VDETIPQVDGLRLTVRVQDAGRGEIWRARTTGGLAGGQGARLPAELPGVGECLVRLLRMPVHEALRARAQTLARDLLVLSDPGLVTVRAVHKAHDGIALVYGHVPAPSTGLHLLARRRFLRAGEVVTLGVALCWALAHAHDAGVTHGRLRDADVLVGGDGRPVLTGVGVLGVLGAPGEAEGDVRALERMLGSLLDHDSAGASRVIRVLGEGIGSAGELAAMLAAATPALPIEIEDTVSRDAPGPVPAVAHRRRRARRRSRIPQAPKRQLLKLRSRLPRVQARVVLAAAGIVLLGTLVGWASAPAPHRAVVRGAPVPSSRATIPAVDWRQVLARLDLARSAAFARPRAGAFSGVDLPGSPAARYDQQAAAALVTRGVHAVGLVLVLERVTVQSVSAHRVELQVTDRRLPYELRDARGRLVSRVAARGEASHLVDLEVDPAAGLGAWRFAGVTTGAG
jgi:hypothetical protein